MKKATVEPIKLVVFDLGGTAVDHGCMAPVAAFVEAFEQMGVTVSPEQARGPMGLHKRDHIRELFKLPKVAEQWLERHGQSWSENDVQQIYDQFVPLQAEIAKRHAEIVPDLLQCIGELREQEIAIGASTGYPRSVTDPILEAIAKQGFVPEFCVCADEVPAGRPAPWMIFRNMEALGIFPPECVVKVGDTVPDMGAARNAGVWAVAVSETGSEFGLTHEQLTALPQAVRDEKHEQVANKLRDAGAHEVIRSLAELPAVIRASTFRDGA